MGNMGNKSDIGDTYEMGDISEISEMGDIIDHLLMRSLGLIKLSNKQIFQLQVSLFLAVKRPNRPLR